MADAIVLATGVSSRQRQEDKSQLMEFVHSFVWMVHQGRTMKNRRKVILPLRLMLFFISTMLYTFTAHTLSSTLTLVNRYSGHRIAL